MAEELVMYFEDWPIDIFSAKEMREKGSRKNEESLRGLWGNLKHSSVDAIQGPEEDGESGAEKVFKCIKDEHFQTLIKKKILLEFQNFRTPSRERKRKPPGSFLLQLLKTKTKWTFETSKREKKPCI